MCFHNSLSAEAQTLENRYQAKLLMPSEYKPVYHASAFIHPHWPVITTEFRDVFQIFSWGLIPFWTQDSQTAFKLRQMTLNARLESLLSKKAFSVPAKQKRCIVPSTGFFEWERVRSGKIPWFIHHQTEHIFSMAGLWDTWTDNNNGMIYQTFSIVTTVANAFMEKIHNTKKRMPLILTKENEELWISSETPVQYFLENNRHESVNLIAHTISPLISSKNKSTNVPEVQKKYNYFIDGTLF